ncbi:methyltransferase domain-containing protein [Ekhidna sp.]|uniref:class I SAM-dependent methyltransferase n=1 Tax=Ekhidna sp. TaxID=2608089 RepID=UPI003BAB4C64
MQAYEEIFNQRGRSYHMAMEKYPSARDEEFKTIVKKLRQSSESTILDLPAGGGYLHNYLNENVNYLAYDFSGEFNDHHLGIHKCKESKIDLEDESVTEIVSLAALHHIVARKDFYTEMYRILKPGGRMIIADVKVDDKISRFLNGFVDQWNSMGHQGKFIRAEDQLELRNAGFDVNVEDQSYLWNFQTEAEALEFFRLLFRLDINPSDTELKNALSELGTNDNNGFSVSWGLCYLICSK